MSKRYREGQLVLARRGSVMSVVAVIEKVEPGFVWLRKYRLASGAFGRQTKIPAHDVRPLTTPEQQARHVALAKERLATEQRIATNKKEVHDGHGE